MLRLLIKYVKSTILNMLSELNKTMENELKEIKRTLYEQIGNVHKEKKYERKQMEIVWLKIKKFTTGVQ